ncbi:MAG: class I SAM-dependent methyltransferase [Rubrivivax sp.]|nr:class I SAM-dependent methyltransferase [Rubrivivax sp.]
MSPDRAEAPATPPFVFDDGAAYELMMGRWSALVAKPFLDWLSLPDGLAWLDDGCGDGSFTESLVLYQRPATVVGVDPAPGQLSYARRRVNHAGVCFLQGDAQALPLPSASVDAAVMALVLFFVPDPLQGVREMVRVVKDSGTVAAYQWDLDGGGLPLQPILDALHAEGYKSQPPPSAWAATMKASGDLWRSADLVDVRTCQFEVNRTFDSFDDYWRTAYGSPRLRELFASLSPTALQRLAERVSGRIGDASDRPIVLTARANAVSGRKP